MNYCTCTDPIMCRDPVPGCKAMLGDDLPRCPACGHNRLDAAVHMDHHLCRNNGFFDPAPAGTEGNGDG